jgi:hypothetical protein
MDPTLFAAFCNPGSGERAFSDLLDIGVQPEDLSLVISSKANGGQAIETSDRAVVYDAGSVNGLNNFVAGHQRIENEGSFVHESSIGGGISTSSRNDSVSGVEEMDDSQKAAEDELYPETGRPYSYQEAHDVAEAANKGFFNTTEPDEPTIGAIGGPDDGPEITFDVSSINVNGIGRVIGDGTLATLATGAAVAANTGGESAVGLSDYLVDAGVPSEEVDDFYAPFSEGGAILAATIRPGDANALTAEELLTRLGAAVVRTYNDFPEPNGVEPT